MDVLWGPEDYFSSFDIVRGVIFDVSFKGIIIKVNGFLTFSENLIKSDLADLLCNSKY